MFIPFGGEYILPYNELQHIVVSYRDVFHSQCEVIMKLQHLLLQTARKLLRHTICKAVASCPFQVFNCYAQLLV